MKQKTLFESKVKFTVDSGKLNLQKPINRGMLNLKVTPIIPSPGLKKQKTIF